MDDLLDIYLLNGVWLLAVASYSQTKITIIILNCLKGVKYRTWKHSILCASRQNYNFFYQVLLLANSTVRQQWVAPEMNGGQCRRPDRVPTRTPPDPTPVIRWQRWHVSRSSKHDRWSPLRMWPTRNWSSCRPPIKYSSIAELSNTGKLMTCSHQRNNAALCLW